MAPQHFSGSMDLEAFKALARQGFFKAVISSFEAVEVSTVSDEVERDCVLAWALSRTGSSQRALDVASRAYEKAQGELGPDSPVTLMALNDVARFKFRAGLVDEGLLLGEEVLARRSALLGEDDPKTLTSLANLLRYRFEAGRDVSVADLDSLVARWASLDPGREDPAHLSAALLRADVMQDLARRARADVVAWYIAALGDEHPDTLRAQVS